MENKLKLYSWNVNGLRACLKKGFLDWMLTAGPDILALQETRVLPEQLLPDEFSPPGYKSIWYPAEKKGYSGVAFYIREDLKPDEIINGLGSDKFDSEGRTLALRFGNIVIINSYFPNTQRDHARLGFKLEFNHCIHTFLDSLKKKGLHTILCGDYNVAHTDIDLANPKSNENNAGFLPEERAWMSEFLDSGYTDTFRYFYPDTKNKYTWWSYIFNSRSKNIGWRIDYFCVNNEFLPGILKGDIHDQVPGSDHCPISLLVNFNNNIS